MTADQLHEHQPVQIRWQEQQWIDATVHRIYERGADVKKGNDVSAGAQGLFYVLFDRIRERSSL